MATRGYEEDYNAYSAGDGAMEHSQGEDGEDDWGLFSSSSPSSSSPVRPATSSVKLRPPASTLASSRECSMDDDSSSDSEELESSRSKRRAVSSLQQSVDPRQSQALLAQQRRAKIKEMQSNLQQECLALCRSLLPLQRQWRQGLEDSVPGLMNFEHMKQEEKTKRKDNLSSRSEIQVQRSISQSQGVSVPSSHLNNSAMTVTDSSLKRTSKAPLRRKLPWRSNEREAIRRGILMFGVGRSEKVRGVMRGSVKHLQHGLGDIADCCWEFVRACSLYSDVKDHAFVENLLHKAGDMGIEFFSELTERVGQWEKMEKSGAVWLKRIRLLDSLGHVIKLCANPATQEVAYNAIDSLQDATVPCDWWTRESDLALLAGIYRHGFGNYEAVRMDEEFAEAFKPAWESRGAGSSRKGVFSNNHDQSMSRNYFEHSSEGEPLDRDPSNDASWPDSNVLTRRLKRLVEHLVRVRG